MGLTYSSRMLKRLKGNMYIVSHNGLVHVSPEDVTTQSLSNSWPGTFVLVDLDISAAPQLSLEDLLAEVRGRAETELTEAEKNEQANRYYVSIENYFGKWAEDKDAAISFRDRKLIPAIEEGKKIEIDFRGVETVPHSFLNALLASRISASKPAKPHFCFYSISSRCFAQEGAAAWSSRTRFCRTRTTRP